MAAPAVRVRSLLIADNIDELGIRLKRKFEAHQTFIMQLEHSTALYNLFLKQISSGR